MFDLHLNVQIFSGDAIVAKLDELIASLKQAADADVAAFASLRSQLADLQTKIESKAPTQEQLDSLSAIRDELNGIAPEPAPIDPNPVAPQPDAPPAI